MIRGMTEPTLRRAAAALVALAFVAGAARAQDGAAATTTMLRLRSGGILWGTIDAHDPDGISFRRLTNDGVVRLPWSRLDPNEEAGLRLRFGYVDAAADEVMVDADRIALRDGTEIVGRIVNRTEEHVWVKRAEGTVPVAKKLISGGSTIVQVPALDVFTKEELYQEKATELQSALLAPGAVGARAHWELAQFSERVFDFPHALEHYRLAARSDPSFQAAAVQAAIGRAQSKAENQEQVDMLAEADLMRARKRYDKSVALLREFPTLYPQSPLLEDWNRLTKLVARDQERALRETVVDRWHYWAARLAAQAARSMESYQEVLGYLDGAMGEELLRRVHEDLTRIAPEIQPDEVRRLWNERRPGRPHQATYSYGTWLLGKDRALAEIGGEREAEEAAERDSQTDARRRIEERVQRYLRNQELAAKAKSEEQDGDDPEAFWSAWASASRAQWILAYYVESSGDFELLNERLSNCRECGGSGAREIIYTGGAISGQTASSGLVACPSCHNIGRVRRIRYR